MVPTILAPNNDRSSRMCVGCQPINNVFVHEEGMFDIRQRIKQYEDQASEGYQRLVFDPGGWIWLRMSKESFSHAETFQVSHKSTWPFKDY